MLIGFLGAPMSGKTTAALGLTYHLKLEGMAAEYLPEPARVVIDRLGYNDQTLIAEMEAEHVDRAKKHPDRMWITDGGLYLGQFYGGAVFAPDDYDTIVFCSHVFNAATDSGRLHNHDQALRIQSHMRAYAGSLANCVHHDPNQPITRLMSNLLACRQ